MLYPKILLVLVGLCILTSSWTPAAAQPTLPIESIPEDLPPKLRAALEMLYDENPETRWRSLWKLRELGPQAVEKVLPYLVSMMGDTGAFHEYHHPFVGPPHRVEDSLAATLAAAGTSARDPLLKALSDESAQVRRCAVKAIGLTKNRADAQRVAALAGDTDSGVRAAVAESLGLLADPGTVEALAGLLADEDESVRKAAAKALLGLGEVGVDRLVQAAEEQGAGTAEAFEALASVREPRAVGPLLSALSSEDATLRASAASQLKYYKAPEVTQGLVAALGDRHPGVRDAAARSLASAGDATAVEALIAALKDDSCYVRMRAAYALERIADPRAVEPLIQTLGDNEPEVRRSAASALGTIGDRRAVEPLINALADSWSKVQTSAAEALGEINDTQAVEPLMALLVKSNEEYAAEAAKGRPRFLRWNDNPLLFNRELQRLKAIIKALGLLGDARAVRPIFDTIQYADCETEVLEALGQLDIEQELDLLLAGLNDGEQRTRECAARVLAGTDDPKAIDALTAALDDRMLRGRASDSLREIGQPAVESLVRVLKEGSIEARREAASILGRAGSSEAIPALISALREDDKELQNRAVRSLHIITRDKYGPKPKLGRDADKWQAWWDKQQESQRQEDEPDSVE